MGKIDVKTQNPVRYAKIKQEQQKLKDMFDAVPTLAIQCPYCGHKVGVVFKGQHSAVQNKCPNCSEEFIFPPISFSKSCRSH